MATEKPADPFFGPETAIDEIAERIATLRKQAARERTEAMDLMDRLVHLRDCADKRDHIAQQYESLIAN